MRAAQHKSASYTGRRMGGHLCVHCDCTSISEQEVAWEPTVHRDLVDGSHREDLICCHPSQYTWSYNTQLGTLECPWSYENSSTS